MRNNDCDHAEQGRCSNAEALVSPREDFEVFASGVYPAGSSPCQLPEAVLLLFPQHFSSVTSAKRACRRGEIWLEGTMSKTKFGK